MNRALHIVRKDLRRLRWVLMAWTFVVATRVLLETVGSAALFAGSETEIIVEWLSGLTRLIEVLMPALLVSLLVHDEPLVGYDAFWLTRPFDRRALFAAKLGLVTAFLIVLPVAGKAVVMALFDAEPGQFARATPAFVLTYTWWTFPLVAVATLTSSLTRFVLTIVGAIHLSVSTAASLTRHHACRRGARGDRDRPDGMAVAVRSTCRTGSRTMGARYGAHRRAGRHVHSAANPGRGQLQA